MLPLQAVQFLYDMLPRFPRFEAWAWFVWRFLVFAKDHAVLVFQELRADMVGHWGVFYAQIMSYFPNPEEWAEWCRDFQHFLVTVGLA